MTDISCEIYNKDRIAIRGNKEKYKDILKNIEARWNSRMKGGEGWILPTEREKMTLKN